MRRQDTCQSPPDQSSLTGPVCVRRLEQGENLEENQKNLLQITERFFQAIIGSSSEFPPQLRSVCHCLYQVGPDWLCPRPPSCSPNLSALTCVRAAPPALLMLHSSLLSTPSAPAQDLGSGSRAEPRSALEPWVLAPEQVPLLGPGSRAGPQWAVLTTTFRSPVSSPVRSVITPKCCSGSPWQRESSADRERAQRSPFRLCSGPNGSDS